MASNPQELANLMMQMFAQSNEKCQTEGMPKHIEDYGVKLKHELGKVYKTLAAEYDTANPTGPLYEVFSAQGRVMEVVALMLAEITSAVASRIYEHGDRVAEIAKEMPKKANNQSYFIVRQILFTQLLNNVAQYMIQTHAGSLHVEQVMLEQKQQANDLN